MPDDTRSSILPLTFDASTRIESNRTARTNYEAPLQPFNSPAKPIHECCAQKVEVLRTRTRARANEREDIIREPVSTERVPRAEQSHR